MVNFTIGIIVLNGEPYIEYNIASIYFYAHQIIIVEGAASEAAVMMADEHGHSLDGTLSHLREIKKNRDPENKITIITAEDEGHPNGFWPGEKDEMSLAFVKRATGNYLWQIDSDEFYKAEDVEKLMKILDEDPSIEAVSFDSYNFWGDFDVCVDGWHQQRGWRYFKRLFKWEPGYRYTTHRPPTVVNAEGVDLRDIKHLTGKELAEKHGIYMYHYALLFPQQVYDKNSYYSRVSWISRKGAIDWTDEVYMKLSKPFRAHNVYRWPGWLYRFQGTHPKMIMQMQADIIADKVYVKLRHTDDIDRLLNSPFYSVGIFFVKYFDYVDRIFQIVKKEIIKILVKVKGILRWIIRKIS